MKRPLPTDSYTVVYAGRLMGYYRYPEVQSVKNPDHPDHPDVCEEGINEVTTPEAALFDSALRSTENVGTTLRLATGDNFAPFLLSRQMWDGKGLQEKERYSTVGQQWKLLDEIASENKQAYANIQQGGGEPIPTDNVGCFLRLMKFDALVPGEYDFYFGPTRLQELARYLKAPRQLPTGGVLAPARMLGVNLYMQTKELTSAVSQSAADTSSQSKGPPVAEPLKAQAVSQPAADTSSTVPRVAVSLKVQVTTPKVALPWMRSVQIRNWTEGSDACIVDVAKLLSRLNKKKAGDIRKEDEAKICVDPEFPLKVEKAILDYTATIQAPSQANDACPGPPVPAVLEQDTDYAVAVVLPAASGPQLAAWQPFTVVPPFFGYNRLNKTVDCTDRPWITRGDGKGRVAVFGVVDPNLIQSIGRYNAVWLEDPNDHYETDAQVSDPAEALKQAIEYCVAYGDCTPDTRMVLLAQMPQQTAYDMLSSFRSPQLLGKIDLVISEADPERGTGNRTTVRMHDGDEDEFADPVVVVPDPGALVPPFFTDRNTMRARLQRAIVTPGNYFSPDSPRIVRNQQIRPPGDKSITNNWFPFPASAMTPATGGTPLLAHLIGQMWRTEPALKGTVLDGLPAAATPTDDTWQTALQQLALKRMEQRCNSDAGMIQLRDIFYVPEFTTLNLNQSGYEAVMNAIYWKGDYVVCMSVSGATITSVLQRSQDLQQKQFYGLLADTSLSIDWSLVTLGTNESQTNSAKRLVADKLLDPKKLYSIAVTDFLANGDTGYPALQGAEPPPETPWSKTNLVRIADAITQPTLPVERAANVLDTLHRVVTLPASQQHQPNFTFPDWLKGVFKGPDVKRDTGPLEIGVEERPMWSFDLYKSDFSYSMAAHSGLERAIPQMFPGVSAIDLTAADSSSIAVDYLFRIQRDRGSREFYVQSELNYGYKKTRQATKSQNLTSGCTNSLSTGQGCCPISLSIRQGCGDPYVRNQSADFVYNELGYAYRFHTKKNPYGWKLLLPVGVQTQLAPAIALPEGFTTSTSTPSAVIASPRSVYLEGRPGFRWDYSYPKPANWNLGGGGGQSGGASQSSSGGGKGGKGGGSSSSQNSTGGQASSGGGSAQTQTFDTFVEFGYEFGPSLHGPKDFVFSDPTGWMLAPQNLVNAAANTACAAQTQANNVNNVKVLVANVVNCFNAAAAPVTGNNSLGTKFTQPVFITTDPGRIHFQDGLYFNYHFDAPVPIPANRFTVFSNMEVVLDLRSDYFFGSTGDSPVDTHFLVDAKQSLNVPIFSLFSGRVSLAPTVEMIYYTNKISNILYKSYSTSIALSYSFEKRSGLNPWKIFGYQNPVPTLPTLPSR